MRTIETVVYTYAELSDKAKAKARDWYRDASQGDNAFAEYVIQDAATIAEMLGIQLKQCPVRMVKGKTYTEPCINWSGFWSQGDGACFVGSFDPREAQWEKLVLHAPKDTRLHAIADDLREAAQAIPGDWRASITEHDSRYCHSSNMQIDIEHEIDDNGDAPDFSADAEKALLNALRAFADWIYRQLEAEYEYENSDENIAEIIEANEYEFEGDGTRV